MLAHQFPTFQVALNKRGKAWRWCVCTIEGNVVMRGSERSRPAAGYHANRALFLLLLSSSYRLQQRTAPPGLSPPLLGHPRPVD
jgi:hypothetical protein